MTILSPRRGELSQKGAHLSNNMPDDESFLMKISVPLAYVMVCAIGAAFSLVVLVPLAVIFGSIWINMILAIITVFTVASIVLIPPMLQRVMLEFAARREYYEEINLVCKEFEDLGRELEATFSSVFTQIADDDTLRYKAVGQIEAARAGLN